MLDKKLIKVFKYKNIHVFPKIRKLIFNTRLNNNNQNIKILDSFKVEISLITGQFPYISYSKNSISNFKLKENSPTSLFVTIHGKKVFLFLKKFINLAVPRISDFQGFIDKSFDKNGNYNFGVKNKVIFPEIKIEQVLKQNGFDVFIVTSTNQKKEVKQLLQSIQFPFKS